MNIRQRKEIKDFAASRLEATPQASRIILIYTGITLGLALLATVVNYILGLQVDKTGGLSNMGTRAILNTLQQLLPLVQSVIVLCLELGYCAAMLRTARGQYVSHRTLKLGFDRFWPLLRLSIIRGVIFLGAGIASVYLGTLVYILTPLSQPAFAVLEPLMGNVSPVDVALLLDDGVYGSLMGAMVPCFALCGLFFLLLFLPLWYRYRLAAYVLIDKPSLGALMCLRESRLLMKGNGWHFFKLDLSFWYYYGGLLLAGLVSYADVLLQLLGVTLPVSGEASFFGFYLLYLLCQGALYWFLRNRVEVSYAVAYDAVKPEEPKNPGVVLGNIFEM